MQQKSLVLIDGGNPTIFFFIFSDFNDCLFLIFLLVLLQTVEPVVKLALKSRCYI